MNRLMPSLRVCVGDLISVVNIIKSGYENEVGREKEEKYVEEIMLPDGELMCALEPNNTKMIKEKMRMENIGGNTILPDLKVYG